MSQKQNERPDVPEQEERLSAPQENGAEETAAPAEEAVHQPETPAAGSGRPAWCWRPAGQRPGRAAGAPADTPPKRAC